MRNVCRVVSLYHCANFVLVEFLFLLSNFYYLFNVKLIFRAKVRIFSLSCFFALPLVFQSLLPMMFDGFY